MVNKIVNVYKQNYINNIGMGIGDYIRGSFFLLQLCIEYNIEFDLDFSQHPISKFLINTQNNNINIKDNDDVYDINYENIQYIFNHMISINDFMNNFIINKEEEIYYLFTNNHPLNLITDNEKNIIKNKFIPNKELDNAIETTLYNLDLLKNEYIVIHIRVGDRYINTNNKLDENTLNDIYTILENNITFNKEFLLLSDSNELKNILKNKYCNLKIQINEILHLAHDCTNIESLKNTIIDFFLISYASSVISLSIYDHLTGFSEYCCIMNNIPCTKIKLNNYLSQ